MAVAQSGLELSPKVFPRALRHSSGRPPRTVVLLGGTVRPTAFHESIDRSILELPLDANRSLLDHWHEQVRSLSQDSELDLRVLLDRETAAPSMAVSQPCSMEFERDSAELRGTGGLLRDLAARYEPDDFLLVGGGAQLLTRRLDELWADLSDLNADVALATHEDGTPCSLMLVRCGSLSVIPEVGFVDMKEQALPLIARHGRVAVRTYAQHIALAIRTTSQYLSALRWHHRFIQEGWVGENPFAEDWEPRFGIIESGATVQPGALIHDSVILKGSTVGREATVVRSVICAGASVKRGQVVADRLMGRAAGQ